MLRLLPWLLIPLASAAAVRTIATLPKAQITAAVLDTHGNSYIAGYIQSQDLPVTPGVLQSQYHAATCQMPQFPLPCPDGFVAKFDASGNLLYATYLGGSGYDIASAIAVDPQGNAYVAGFTASADFPLTSNRIPGSSAHGAFVSKIDPRGARLLYSTQLPGIDGVASIAVDAAGQALLAGTAAEPGLTTTPGAVQPYFHGGGDADGAVLKLAANGDTLLVATYLGGAGDDHITALALDAAGSVYVAGYTSSADFPFTSGAADTRPSAKANYYDGFVAKLNATGTSLVYAARPAGSCNDEPQSIAVDASGRALVTGWTCSGDYPVVQAPAGAGTGLISSMAFVTVFSAGGNSIEYSTLLGGSQSSKGLSIALDGESRMVVSGETLDPDFPTTAGAPARCNPAADSFSRGFLVRLDPAAPGSTFATYLDVAGPVIPLPGDLFWTAGKDMSGDTRILQVDTLAPQSITLQCAANSASGWSAAVAPGELVTIYGTGLAGAKLYADELPVAVVSSADDQILATLPAELAGRTTTALRAERDAAQSDPLAVTVASAVPGIFRIAPGPTNRAAVLNQDGTVNDSAHPAPRGSTIALWATGLGAGPVHASFFGFPGEIQYAGPAPGMPAGVSQVNVRVPPEMNSFADPVDLVLTSGDAFVPVRLVVSIQ